MYQGLYTPISGYYKINEKKKKKKEKREKKLKINICILLERIGLQDLFSGEYIYKKH